MVITAAGSFKERILGETDSQAWIGRWRLATSSGARRREAGSIARPTGIDGDGIDGDDGWG